MARKKLTPEEQKEHLEAISFTNLVRAIDKKFSHTYLEPEEEDLEFFFEIDEEFNSSL